MKKIYLASPYYHKDPKVRESRFIEVCKKTGELMNQGYFVYSPKLKRWENLYDMLIYNRPA